MSTEDSKPAHLRGADLILVLPAIALLCQLCAYVFLSVHVIQHPFDLERADVTLQLACDLARGRPIYRPLTDFPFVAGDYPPVYLFLNAVAIRLFGLNLWSGRLISFLAALGVSAILLLWVYRETRWPAWSFTVALLPFLSPLFFSRTAFYRVDVLAAALSFLGVYLVACSGSERRDIVAVAVLVLALFTKHSMVAAPAASFLYLLRIDRRRAMRFATWLACTICILCILCIVSTRQEFFRHLVLYHVIGVDMEVFAVHYRTFVRWTAPFALCWGVFVVVALAQSRGRSLAAIYGLTSLVHFLFLRRTGASLHYLLEPSVACFLATGLLLPRIQDVRPLKSLGSAFSAVVLVVLIAVQYGLAGRELAGEETLDRLKVSSERDTAIMEEIRERPGDILAEQPTYVLLAGRDIQVAPFHIAQLAKAGKLDQARIVQAIQTGRFSLIILSSPARQPSKETRMCFTDEMLAAIVARYRPLPDRYPGRRLYEPK
jgi:hypothetical protein